MVTVQVEVELADLQIGQRYKMWYRLQHHEPKPKEKKLVEIYSRNSYGLLAACAFLTIALS